MPAPDIQRPGSVFGLDRTATRLYLYLDPAPPQPAPPAQPDRYCPAPDRTCIFRATCCPASRPCGSLGPASRSVKTGSKTAGRRPLSRVSLGPHPFADGSYSVSYRQAGRGQITGCRPSARARMRLGGASKRSSTFLILPRPALSPATGTDFTRILMTTVAEPAGVFQTSASTAEITPPAAGCRSAARPSPPLPRRGRAPTADLSAALSNLKRGIVERANSFCQADGGSAAGSCTPGLFWVRGADSLPRFRNDACEAGLTRAAFSTSTSQPQPCGPTACRPDSTPRCRPYDHGPFAPGPVSLVRPLSPPQRNRTRKALLDIVDRLPDLPAEKLLFVRSSLLAGTHTYGTPEAPKVTWIEDGAGTARPGRRSRRPRRRFASHFARCSARAGQPQLARARPDC